MTKDNKSFSELSEEEKEDELMALESWTKRVAYAQSSSMVCDNCLGFGCDYCGGAGVY